MSEMIRGTKAGLPDAPAKAGESEDQLRTIINTIPEMVWGARADGWAEYLNKRWLDYAGLTRENAQGWGWLVAIHPDDVDAFSAHWKTIIASQKPGDMEARIRRFDGVYRWHLFRGAPLFDAQDTLINWYGTNTDIDDRKRDEALLAGENRILEMIAKGNALALILGELCALVEKISSGSLCGIMLVDPIGGRLEHGAAPSLPASYNEKIQGRPVNIHSGPCAMAAFLKEQIIVADIASDPRWAAYTWCPDALAHGLRSCWSTPILSSGNTVLGAFAIYSHEPRIPTTQDQKLIMQTTHLASVAIERKQAEDELRRSKGFLADALARVTESEDQLRILIDTVPGHAWTTGPNGEGEFFSRRWLDYSGMSAEEVKGAGWAKAIHPDDAGAMVENWQRIVASREPGEQEARLKRADGEYRWFLFQGAPLLDQAGNVSKWYGTNTDIDDLKRAEALLAAEKKLFEMIATGQTLPVILDTLCRLMEELNGGSRTSVQLYDAEVNQLRIGAAPHFTESFARAMDGLVVTPVAGTCSAAISRKQNVAVSDTATDPLWVNFRALAQEHGVGACWSTPILNVEGAVLGTIATYAHEARQITLLESSTVRQFTHLARIVIERRQADDALKKSEAFLAEGQRLSHTGSWAWKLATDCVVWSAEHGRIFGYDVDEVGGTFAAVLERLSPHERSALLATVGEAVRAGRDFSCEYQIVVPDGSVRQVQSVGRGVFNQAGEVTEYIGTTVDITERKRAEEELRQREADLRKAHIELAHVTRVTAMGEFAASIAHEVNQPIAGVVLNGNACLRWLAKLDRDPASLIEAREAVQRVIRDGTRAGQVIARIRAMFKNTETARESLDFNEAIHEIIVLARSELDKRRVALRLELAGDLPHVLGDRVQLQQVMLNLILNGIEAMSAIDSRPRELLIRTAGSEKRGVLVAVCDCGTGLETASADKIFTAFHTTKPGGLGMGLSISRSIVENHGGRLWATANDGPGAIFQFMLPVSGSSDEVEEQPAGVPAL